MTIFGRVPATVYIGIINLAKRGYCNTGVCRYVCLSVCVSVCPSPMSQCNFDICGAIVTKLDMEVAGYDTCIVEKYYWNRSKVRVTEIV